MEKASLQLELDLATNVSGAIFRPLPSAEPPSASPPSSRCAKISVIGAGNVGMAIAQTILSQGLVDELALVDAKPEKLRGEMLDLQHAATFFPRCHITASTDYAVTAGSDLCIVTAGARHTAEESHLKHLKRNLSLLEEIVPPLARQSPNCVILIVSDPIDLLACVAWNLSRFPPNRVIGTGTSLDSSRFRSLLAEHLGVNPQDVQAYIVGKHGSSSMVLRSSISVAGVPLLSSLNKQNIAYEESLERIHGAVVGSAYELIRLKGYSAWAVGYSVAGIARAILHDERSVHSVSVLTRDLIADVPPDHENFLSLPAILGRSGVVAVASLHLTDSEASCLRRSAEDLWETKERLGF